MPTDLDLENFYSSSSFISAREFIDSLHRRHLSQGPCQLLISCQQIQNHAVACSQIIDRLIKNYISDNIIFVIVMHGANSFFGRLSPLIQKRVNPFHVMKLRCSSYGDSTNGQDEIKLEYIDPKDPIDLLCNGRKVIIIEDIFERGETIRFLVNSKLREFDVEIIGIFSLVDKTKGADLRLNLNKDTIIEKGIVYEGPLFLYGCGPDLLTYLRDLVDIWGITPELFDRIKEFVKEKFPNNSHQTSQNGCPV